jgi:hypothetical protein
VAGAGRTLAVGGNTAAARHGAGRAPSRRARWPTREPGGAEQGVGRAGGARDAGTTCSGARPGGGQRPYLFGCSAAVCGLRKINPSEFFLPISWWATAHLVDPPLVLVAVFCLNWIATSCSGSFCWLLQGKIKMTLHTLVF